MRSNIIRTNFINKAHKNNRLYWVNDNLSVLLKILKDGGIKVEKYSHLTPQELKEYFNKPFALTIDIKNPAYVFLTINNNVYMGAYKND